MYTFKARITPLAGFGTPPKGDTLFGQLCWMLRYRLGEAKLTELLDGYTAGRPFAVLSDALPAGYLPRPTLPSHLFKPLPKEDRKAVKKRVWLPLEHLNKPLADWLHFCRTAEELPGGSPKTHPHPHNRIDRRTGTTGEGFAPYTMERTWYAPGTVLELYLIVDTARLEAEDLESALRDMGELGFGRDASIGLGRFRLEAFEQVDLPAQAEANAWMTLAPCAPQGLQWQADRCFYTVFTRFGRHGGLGVLLGNPFKAPVLLVDTAAVLTPTQYDRSAPFTGQGLGGDGSLSKAIPATVHQGYAPVVGIRLPETREVA